MNSVALLRDQLKWAHDTMEGTMADVTAEVAHYNETNKAIPVGAAYAHCVLGEDMMAPMIFPDAKPLYVTPEDAGISEPMPSQAEWDRHEAWYKSVKVDLEKLRAFAQRVYLATDKYLSEMKETDLEKEIDLGSMGKQSLAWVISNFLILHTANLTGEISAAKGLQGLKGYPF